MHFVFKNKILKKTYKDAFSSKKKVLEYVLITFGKIKYKVIYYRVNSHN